MIVRVIQDRRINKCDNIHFNYLFIGVYIECYGLMLWIWKGLVVIIFHLYYELLLIIIR